MMVEVAAMSTIQSILHPTDFSPEAEYGFRMASSLAKDYNATLYLLHVMLPAVVPYPHASPNPLEPAETQEILQGTFPWPQPPDPNVRVEHRVAEGDAAQEILRVAGAIPCDLIVMGTHGRTGLNRLLTGSVAEEVLRRAPCPVMTIRNAPHEAGPVPAPARPLAKPGEIVDVRVPKAVLTSTAASKLFRAAGVEAARLTLPAGKEVFAYRTRGTHVIHCLEGRVNVIALGKTRELEAGQLLHLPADEPHTIKGIEDAALLLTTALPPE
jgi:nucleotide-binding universal stress UspA family protein/quercetin dioxygenase-like cupin family protein